MQAKIVRRVLRASMILVVLLAACSPRTGAPSANQPAQQQQAGPLRIGASISLTGAYSRTGKELQNGYQLWAEQVNAAGGIMGRRVEFVTYDDTSDPETGARLYEKLISEDKVDLVLGPYSSPVTLAASTVTEKYGYPMIVSGASATDIWTRGYKYVFGIYTMAPAYMDGAIDIAKRSGYTTVAIMNENSAFSKDTADGAAKKAQEAGFQVVFREEYAKDVRDLTPILTRARALNPDVLIGGTYGEDATLIVRQLKDLNWTPRLLSLSIGPALPDFTENLGADAEYVMGSTQWEPTIKSQGAPEFVAAYKAKYGYEPGYHAAGGYGAAQLLAKAVERAGAIDNQRIRDALATMETTTIFGPYKVDSNGAQIAKPSYLIQIQDGQRKLVWPDSAAEASAVVPMPEWSRRPSATG